MIDSLLPFVDNQIGLDKILPGFDSINFVSFGLLLIFFHLFNANCDLLSLTARSVPKIELVEI